MMITMERKPQTFVYKDTGDKMKKTVSLCLLITFILAGCSSPLHHNIVIDWVDFVKWDGKEYDGISGRVIANESFLGEKIGGVKFKVADNVETSLLPNEIQNIFSE